LTNLTLLKAGTRTSVGEGPVAVSVMVAAASDGPDGLVPPQRVSSKPKAMSPTARARVIVAFPIPGIPATSAILTQ
jgi:hypothetical protein